MNSEISIKTYALIKNDVIKSNVSFWRDFSAQRINDYKINIEPYRDELIKENVSLTSVFDYSFPKFDVNLAHSEKPFLFAYKGDLSLLNSIDKNIAIIGTLTPTYDIIQREIKLVKELVYQNAIIISGLACGCDTIAHETCLKNNGKTIAILPTTFNHIYPDNNSKLVDNIINNNGLVITEYVTDTNDKYKRIKRFIDRDRLQALFSKSVVLIASFRKDEGDSGSRHAMYKAESYKRIRYVMFNEQTDFNKNIFGLNQDLLTQNVKVLTKNSIKELLN